MKYFFINIDEAKNSIPRIINWYNKLNTKYIQKGMAYNLPQWTILEIEENKNVIFTDIISYPFFLVSETIKEVIEFYDVNIEWKNIILFDYKNQINNMYYLPILEKIDCISSESKWNFTKVELLEPILDINKIQDNVIFKLGEIEKTKIIVRLDLAESILRRNVKGISLLEIKTKEGREK